MHPTLQTLIVVGLLVATPKAGADAPPALTEHLGRSMARWQTAVARLEKSEGAAPKTTFTFGKDKAGALPAGWKAEQTGAGKGSEWKVVKDETAPSKSGQALAQTAASPRALFNLCVEQKLVARDVEISVEFKAVKGKVDQGGGLVWRYQDANNYYVARMNPLEDNYRLYKVIDGKRTQLATTEDNVVVPENSWQRLTIRHAGSKITCFLDGKKLLEAEDNAIAKAGKIGLWTKADAQTYFDQLIVAVLPTKQKE